MKHDTATLPKVLYSKIAIPQDDIQVGEECIVLDMDDSTGYEFYTVLIHGKEFTIDGSNLTENP